MSSYRRTRRRPRRRRSLLWQPDAGSWAISRWPTWRTAAGPSAFLDPRPVTRDWPRCSPAAVIYRASGGCRAAGCCCGGSGGDFGAGGGGEGWIWSREESDACGPPRLW